MLATSTRPLATQFQLRHCTLDLGPPKIIVLADDLSGAAELAGIAFSYGFSAEVQRDFEPLTDAQVIALDTDSRHLPAEAAYDRLAEVSAHVLKTNPSWIFKKVDSVLRGNVRAEVEAVMHATGQPRAVLIPANPTRGRIVRGQQYFIDNIPLEQTSFARDPEYPRISSDVATLMGGDGKEDIHLIGPDAPLPLEGVIVPDVASNDDLFRRGIQVDKGTLLAGAADFFTSLLGQRCPTPRRRTSAVRLQPPVLLVCGSMAAWRSRSQQCQEAGIPILPVFSSGASSSPRDFRRLLVGIAESERWNLKALLTILAGLTKIIIENSLPKTLLAEGGATAAAIAGRMNWIRFEVVGTAPAGVGVLQPLDPSTPLFLIKPGSYPWPPEIWQAFCMC